MHTRHVNVVVTELVAHYLCSVVTSADMSPLYVFARKVPAPPTSKRTYLGQLATVPNERAFSMPGLLALFGVTAWYRSGPGPRGST